MEPILSPAQRISHGLITPDFPFDSYAILSALSRKSFSYPNAEFHKSSTPLSHLHIAYERGKWEIASDTLTATAPIIVCAAGALNPVLLQNVAGHDGQMTVQKSLIAVLHTRLCNRILALRTPPSEPWPNVLPFDAGTTISMPDLNSGLSSEQEADAWTQAITSLEERLMIFYPGLLDRCPLLAHFYPCEKLNNSNHPKNPFPEKRHGGRHYFWIEDPHNFFCYYPGKFVTAPLAARRLSEKLAERLGEKRGLSVPSSGAQSPKVVERPYFDAPTHVGNAVDGRLAFTRISG